LKRFNDIVTVTAVIVLQWLQWFQMISFAARSPKFM